jgi:hypothetical protein
MEPVWTVTETTYEAKPEDYRLVRGAPGDVEKEVSKLITAGYELNGEIMEYIIPNTSTKIFVQAMVKYGKPKKA